MSALILQSAASGDKKMQGFPLLVSELLNPRPQRCLKSFLKHPAHDLGIWLTSKDAPKRQCSSMAMGEVTLAALPLLEQDAVQCVAGIHAALPADGLSCIFSAQ